uniref:Pre-mRNA splicing Prp18-interacting factor n=1 Tax=Tanacetum cinerariifolium TaxID=118510 RepID=A0A699HCJ9_TANCI|nr:hypothetical protein [Tanacetum cinerariifolium]
MSSFNQRECLGCGQPCDGYHYSCTCQQCGGIGLNCIHGNGKPITCYVCEGPLRGGFCLFCDSKAENSFTNDPNAYSFNDTSSNCNHLPQPQLCGNDSHYGYDCPPQFPFVYEQEPSYDQNYNDNYYSHNSSSFLCCNNCEGSHETFQCQPMDQNIDSSGFDQIQTPRYPVIHHTYQEMSKEVFQAKGNLMNYIQTFLEKFNSMAFGEMPKICRSCMRSWKNINSPSWNRPTFFDNDEEHSVQYKEYLENSSNEIAALNFNQEKEEPPQDSNIRQLVREECGIKVCEEQNQNMEDMMLELLDVCRQKEFYCMHNDVDDLIESALNSKLFSINLESQRLDKKKQEVKTIVKHPTKRGTRIAESLQNFRVKKSSISLNNTSQISPVHAIAPVLPIEEPEYSLSMGYEHLSTIPKTESDEVIESSVKNLLPIPSEYEVTSDDESECDVPIKDESSQVFTTFSNPLFDYNDDFTSSDDESLSDEDVPMEDFKVYSNPFFDDDEINFDKIDPHYFNAESDFVESFSNCDTLFDSSPKFDFLEEFSGEFMPTSINSCPRLLENFHANTIVETLPTSPTPVEDSDSQREEIDIFTGTNDLSPPSIKSDDYDSERDIHFLKELLVDDSIPLPKNESSGFDHHDDPLFSRPPLEPPDVEFFFNFEPNLGEVIPVVINNIDKLNEDECFDPGEEIDVFANVEDDDYFPFIFVIRIFLPYLIFPEVSPLLLSAESEDTIFDPGISV